MLSTFPSAWHSHCASARAQISKWLSSYKGAVILLGVPPLTSFYIGLLHRSSNEGHIYIWVVVSTSLHSGETQFNLWQSLNCSISNASGQFPLCFSHGLTLICPPFFFLILDELCLHPSIPSRYYSRKMIVDREEKILVWVISFPLSSW